MSEHAPNVTREDPVFERRGASPEEPLLSEEMPKLVEMLVALSPEERGIKLAEVVAKVVELEKKVRTDDLTGLLNRAGFREEWDRYTALLKEQRSKGRSIPSAFLMLDLDGFKAVNENVGHDAGDRFLELVAEKTKAVLNPTDVIGRTGGDEFVVFLFDTSADNAKMIARKLRIAIEEINGVMRSEYKKYRANASASIGVVTIDGEGHIGDDQYTTLEQHPTMAEIKNYADYALYVAKDKGKRGEFTLREAWDADPERTLEEAYLNR